MVMMPATRVRWEEHHAALRLNPSIQLLSYNRGTNSSVELECGVDDSHKHDQTQETILDQQPA